MKNSLDYLRLWQKKRSELPGNDDPQADWLHMHSILDQQMPVIEKPLRFKGFKILPTMFIALSAAAMVYVISHVYVLEKYKYNTQHKFHLSSHNMADSMKVDSLHESDSVKNVTGFSKSTIPGTVAEEDPTSGKDDLLISNRLLRGKIPAPANAALNTTPEGGSLRDILISGNNLAASNKKGLTSFKSENKGPLINFTSTVGRGHSFIVNKITGKRLSKIKGGKYQRNFYNNTVKLSGHQKSSVTKQHLISPNTINNNGLNYVNLVAIMPRSDFNSDTSSRANPSLVQPYTIIEKNAPAQSKSSKNKTEKSARIKTTGASNLDWAVLIGANSSGSFTSSKQNRNFYGSAPVDVFFGILAAHRFNDNWGINPHVNLFSPQIINTTYSHINQSKVDSSQSLQITSSRKLYSVNIPVYITYKPSGIVTFKAGPVFNIPIRQINANTTLQPNIIRSDSVYHRKTTGILSRTQYVQTFNYGISGGVSFQFKRLIFDLTYSKSLSGYKVTSDFGSYKSFNGTLQFSVGFQLNKPQPQ